MVAIPTKLYDQFVFHKSGRIDVPAASLKFAADLVFTAAPSLRCDVDLRAAAGLFANVHCATYPNPLKNWLVVTPSAAAIFLMLRSEGLRRPRSMPLM